MTRRARKLRVGIIGCGVVAPVHAEGYRAQDGVELVWACDLVKERARRLAKKYGIARITTDYGEVMADDSVDCVSVCTNHASHVPITVAALQSGKHVLCEKALAANAGGLDRMFAAHARHPRLVFSGIFQQRFEPVHQCLKRMVDEGAFGKLLTGAVQVRCLRTGDYFKADKWRGSWGLAGGTVLINQAIHLIDLLAWVMGGVKSVSGHYANRARSGLIETEDTATASVLFRSGALGTIEATCSSNLPWETTLSIHGTSGSVDIRNGQPLKMVFERDAWRREINNAVMTSRKLLKKSAVKDYYGIGHTIQIADFISSIRMNRKPFVPAASARHAVDIVLGIYQSHRHGGRSVQIGTGR
jgi:UDP-N-acetyl-2-amino-2-deoxyglucuronate dehydrogenase